MTAPRATGRRLSLLALPLGAVLALAACTGTSDATPSASAPASSAAAPTASASAAPSTTVSASAMPVPSGSTSAGGAAQQYLGFVQQFSPTLAALQPDVLVQLGQQVCTGFRSGQDSGEVAVALGNDDRAPGLEAGDVAVILGAAVATFCPQYRDALAG